ncbi:LysR family transcriptional regulator [Photobacterium makurazakiensis]|uniref:LysR family transcriptional regulator n=1 Tax=Photobacterium makurazakiensis TaxID=2910234 RepID=UPI003D11DA34
MELKTLKSFITVATLKNFSAAARELNTVQPAISRHITALEEELGVKLFVRNSREVHVTAAGQQLLVDATTLLNQAHLTKQQAQRTARGEIGTLRIAYLGSACLTFIADLVRNYKSEHPYVEVSLLEMTASEQIKAFQDKQIDVGFSRPLPSPMKEQFNSMHVYTDTWVVIVPNCHALASGPSVNLTELEHEPIVLFNRSEAVGLFDEIITLCRQSGFSPQIVNQPTRMQTVITTVAAGLGIAIVPKCVTQLHSVGCQVIPITNLSPTIQTLLHTNKQEVTPTAQHFKDKVQDQLPFIQKLMA